MTIRYRVGADAQTGAMLVGWPHCAQSVARILTTIMGERVMRLQLGSDLLSHIGEDLDAATVAAIYRDSVTAIHAQEPEYRVVRLRMVRLERTGGLGLELGGLYFPEGRLGNYRLKEAADGSFALLSAEGAGRRAA